MDLISVHEGSPAGRQLTIRGISSPSKACKDTHTHTHIFSQSRSPYRVSENGKYQPWPQTEGQWTAFLPGPLMLGSQHYCSSRSRSRSAFLSFLGLCLACIICIFFPSPLFASLTHCLSLPLITYLLGVRGFLIIDSTAFL